MNFPYTVDNYYHYRHSTLRITSGAKFQAARARARMRHDSLLTQPAFAQTECRNLQGNCTWPLIKRGVIRQMVAYYRASPFTFNGNWEGNFLARGINLDLANCLEFRIGSPSCRFFINL